MLLNIIKELEAAFLVLKLAKVRVGDVVKISVLCNENSKDRVQLAEGLVIATKHFGLNKTVTIRRIIYGVGVERTYFLSSPRLRSIEVVSSPEVHKSKLYYLRSKLGKDGRIPQNFR